MRDRTFTNPGRWPTIGLAALLVALVLPAVAIAAGGSFTDDDTSIFEADIEWLAGAGVTKGCNPPANTLFCPEDEVTRGQMAAFMRRFAQFLGAEDGVVSEADYAAAAGSATTAGHAAAATSAIRAGDADRVGGFTASELVRVGGCSVGDAPNADYQCEFALHAPADGAAALTGSVDVFTNSAFDSVTCEFVLDEGLVGSSTRWVDLRASDGPRRGTCASTAIVPLATGTHTVRFEVTGVGASTYLFGVAAHGVYSAHDGTGG